ncbi:N-6 DNA methylase [Burkholderia sp. WSM2230]|uniref:N-6 DNA methylase n=1 Tax=Burkholderia sp. WSM2230 TaxID=944435 RepID=UPI0004082D19|nr:N-6 DNA methylase [Burkholderia sp. WSM2230]
MIDSLSSERDVEVKVITTLFREILGYSEEEMRWAVPVKMNFGREVKTKAADLVIQRHGETLVVVEAKKPTEAISGATGQTDSYAFALQSPFSFITNGKEYRLRAYYHGNKRVDLISDAIETLNKKSFSKLIKLIGSKEISGTTSEAAGSIQEPDAEKIRDYRRFFKGLHNSIRDGDKLDPAAAFDELSKLLLMSAADEALNALNSKHKRLTAEDVENWLVTSHKKATRSVNIHFKEVVHSAFPLLSDETSEINLSPETIAVLLKKLEPFSVKSDDVDVKGRAFEEFLPSQLRGKGLGQYFTPRPVVNFMCSLAEVSLNDVVLDFACGSGGFLIKAYEKMKSEVEVLPAGTIKRLGTTRHALLEDIKVSQIFGIDAEPRAARTARMNMLLWGDGKCVVRGNALAFEDFSGNPYQVTEYDENVEGSGCTLILANPPFGAREKDTKILSHYDFGSRRKIKASQKTEVLFVEKALRLLRPEGRLLIVLPTGLLSAGSYADLRMQILKNAWVRGIVNLPTHTFVQSGIPTVNTVVLYLQKYTQSVKNFIDDQKIDDNFADFKSLLSKNPQYDYEILMADSENVGSEFGGDKTKNGSEPNDLDQILQDINDGSDGNLEELDIFDFAERLYGIKSFRRRDQSLRGAREDGKVLFKMRASKLIGRMDPSYYVFQEKIKHFESHMEPIGQRVKPVSDRFRPKTAKELDAEYSFLSISSDGKVTTREVVRGEDILTPQKKVEAGDIIYNPMRINIGSVGVIDESQAGGLISPDYHVVRPDGIDAEYLIGLLRTPFYKFYIDIVTTGSIRDRLYPQDLQKLLIPKTDASKRKRIKDLQNAIADEIDDSQKKVSEYSIDLNEAVRQMLPKV